MSLLLLHTSSHFNSLWLQEARTYVLSICFFLIQNKKEEEEKEGEEKEYTAAEEEMFLVVLQGHWTVLLLLPVAKL